VPTSLCGRPRDPYLLAQNLDKSTTLRKVGVSPKPFWIQVHKVHVYEVYAHEAHAYEVHAHEVHTHEVHTCEVHAYEVHTREVHAYVVEMSAHALDAFSRHLELWFSTCALFRNTRGGATHL